MTVAKTGPSGYEHQYRISVLMGLLFENDKPQLFIESVGEEDATLLLRQGGHPGLLSKIEIQIKSSKNAVDIEDVAEILATFPKGQSKDCLLERLLSHPDSMAFLFFGGRCKDPLSNLVVPLRRLPSGPRNSDPLSRDQSIRLLNAFGAVYRGGKATPLRKARDSVCADLAKNTTVDTFKALARRIFVIEQTGSEQVLDEIQRVLVKNLRVPEAIARKLADAPLRRLVEAARDSGSDCVPSLLEEVGQHQSDAICPRQPYLVQEYEDDLYNRLEKTRVLLLTGLPLSGKTQLAHSLAQRAQAQGVHVVKLRHVDEAYRFLLDPAAGESRLVLLEDPFGKLQLSGDGVEDWNRLAELIADLKPHRSLIVTSRSDVLAAQRGSTEIADWVLEGIEWFDMAMGESRALVQNAWVAWATAQKRDVAEIDALRARLLSETFATLQPGHVSFLARDYGHDYRKLNDLDIVALARKEAAELSRELCSSSHGALVLRGLGASATTLHGPDEATLAFILGNESSSWPGRRPEERSAETTTVPKLDSALNLRAEWIEALNKFERRGVVEWSGDHCRFTHPLWEESAVQALLVSGRFATKECKRLLKNALYCADAVCASNAVGALARMILGFEEGTLSADFVALMLDATESIFPRVGDSAVAFLLDNLDELPFEIKKEVVWAAESSIYSSRLLSWTDGVAFFSKRTDGYELAEVLKKNIERQKRLEILCKDVNPEDFSVDQLLEIYENKRAYNAVNVAHLERGIGVEESIVRAEAYHLIARYHHQSHPDLVVRGLSDPHPSVVVRTMVGLGLAWSSVAPAQQREWLELLSTKLRRVGFGFVALQSLTAFRRWAGQNSDWYHGKTASWDYWCVCMISALSTDPGYFGLDEAKVYDLVEQAVVEVPVASAVELCGAWLDWTERRSFYGIPSDYGGAMADLLLRATESNAPARGDLVSRMSRQTDTALQAMLIRDLCQNWSLLSPAEQDGVMKCLQSPRIDVRWLKAVVVVDGKAPLSVLEELTGCRNPLSRTAVEVVEQFPEQLLHDALHVYCGYPQPLWFIGTHHINIEFWNSVLTFIAGMPQHALWDLAIRELLRRDDEDPHGLAVWEKLCRTGDAPTLERMFQALLNWTIRISAASLGPFWWLIVRSPAAAPQLDDWGRRVGDEIEGISYSDNQEIVLAQLPEALKHLPGERTVLTEHGIIHRLEEMRALDEPEANALLVTMARRVLETVPPRGFRMLDWLISLIQRNTSDGSPSLDETAASVLDAAQARRSAAISKGAERVRSLALEDFELPGWKYTRSSE